ncbi:MAG: glycosyltransferase [Elusimicrobia bacterium]|nr:glycosyltransferase [Elusimicrobiota bacterium]
MKNFTLSIVLPNFNHGQYLDGLLQGMLNQAQYCNEIIIVDDASTDNSVEIIKKYAKKNPIVRLLRNDKNLGVVPTLEKGLKYAKGNYVCLPAADDQLLSGFFKKSMEILKKHPQAGMCCCDSFTIWGHTGEKIVNKKRLSNEACYIPPEKLVNIMRGKVVYLSGFGSIFKRNALDEASLLPELLWSADRFYATIIALRFGICYVPKILSFQLRRKDSYSEQGMNDWKKHKGIIKNALELLKEPSRGDVLPKFKKSCALASLEMPMLRFLLTNKKHWDYLSFNLVRLILWQEFKKKISGWIPSFIKKFADAVFSKFIH